MSGRTRGAIRLVRFALAAGILAAAAQVGADDEAPPVAYLRTNQPAAVMDGPAASQAVLYEQANATNVGGVTSQNYETAYDLFDSRGADDFTIPGGVASWELSSVLVQGQYLAGAAPNVSSVNVQFFANSAADLPGTLIYNLDVVPAGDPSTGVFTLNLSPIIKLVGGGHYWVSVQANKNWLTGQWAWFEFNGQNYSPSAWQNPGDGYQTPCRDWGARASVCQIGENPDLVFRLDGEVSDTYPAPQITRLSPAAAANRAFQLEVEGVNFAPGAELQWTVQGSPKAISATVHSSTRLTANIAESDVSAVGQSAEVRVSNPGPCDGTCQSNTLSFAIGYRLYLPVILK